MAHGIYYFLVTIASKFVQLQKRKIQNIEISLFGLFSSKTLRSSVLLASSESPLKLTRPSLKLKHWTQNLESTENDLHKNFLLTDVFNFSLFQRGLSREKNKFLRKVLRCYPMKFRKDWREQRRPWEKEIRISDSWDFEMNSHSKGKEVFWFLRDFL